MELGLQPEHSASGAHALHCFNQKPELRENWQLSRRRGEGRPEREARG